MNTSNFLQSFMILVLVLGSICVFHLIGLDANFITTFLLTIFVVGISVYFFVETNNSNRKAAERMDEANKKVLSRLGVIHKVAKELRNTGIVPNIKTSEEVQAA